jgi:hypothetical protein
MTALSTSDQSPLNGIDFSKVYDCSSTSETTKTQIDQVASTFGCCGGNNGAPVSTCWVDVSASVCATASDYTPTHLISGHPCSTYAATQGFTDTLNCAGDMTTKADILAGNGCCGDGKKSACSAGTSSVDTAANCDAAVSITDKDSGHMQSTGLFSGQCFNVFLGLDSINENDPTKWIYKKGVGSCAVCKDAVKIAYGPTCKGKGIRMRDGKRLPCKQCAGVIEAYNDCESASTVSVCRKCI